MAGEAVSAILPLFGILLAGYISARAGLFDETASETLNRFVFSLSLPALIFISLARLSPGDFFHWPFIATLMTGMAAVFVLGFVTGDRVFRQRRGEAALHALNAVFSSTGYIGLPLLLVLFGDDALGPGVFGAVVTGAVFLPMALFLIETEKGESARKVKNAVINVLRSPILLSTAAGLAVSALGVTVPAAAASFCDLLGVAFAPCALFSAGLFFVRCSLDGDYREIVWLIGAKLVLHPVITWMLGAWVFGLDGMLLTIAVLLAALPTGVPVFVLAQQYDKSADRSSAVIVLSTAASALTLSVVLWLLEA